MLATITCPDSLVGDPRPFGPVHQSGLALEPDAASRRAFFDPHGSVARLLALGSVFAVGSR